MSLEKVIKELKEIDLGRIIEDGIKNNDESLIRYNTREQLYYGIDALGKQLKPKYSESYKKYKSRIGQPTDRVTLFLKGDFYDGFNISGRGFPFSVESNDSKAGMLEKKYGKNLYGITSENRAKFIKEILLPYTQQAFVKAVDKAFKHLR